MSSKRIVNLMQYKSILPYASEIFGVYQPLIGWKSKRLQDRLNQGLDADKASQLALFASNFKGSVDLVWNDGSPEIRRLEPGTFVSTQLVKNHRSVLANFIAELLPQNHIPTAEEWRDLITFDGLKVLLHEKVFPVYESSHMTQISEITIQEGETIEQFSARRAQSILTIQSRTKESIDQESSLAGALLGLLENKLNKQLENIFYHIPNVDIHQQVESLVESLRNPDPFLAFDPKQDIQDVTLSPIGIVHLYRQYFYQLDTFLGSPVGHIWLSPGSTVELIEVSSRKTITEKFTEFSIESMAKAETSTVDQDEFSEAVKIDNKSDLKLGASATITQSWATGSAIASASLNMNTTQAQARETVHKRMREQSEKLSTEIRKNFKSTFKTITEVTDTSSKRYVLANKTDFLINYELRRKMLQVGVQVQDIGTYLCWQTFVDEPGKQLGLADLVHLATPADLQPQPDQQELAYPPDVSKSFQIDLVWDFNESDVVQKPNGDRLIILKTVPLPVTPDSGYEVAFPDSFIPLYLVSTSKGDQRWAFGAKLKGANLLSLGVWIQPARWISLSPPPGIPGLSGLPNEVKVRLEEEGISYDGRIDFVVSGVIEFVPTAAKKNEIDIANAKIRTDKESSNREKLRKQKDAFIKAAKERINIASKIKRRPYEELREEERIIVYRLLIKSLMSEHLYGLADTVDNQQTRHTLSELINSIFDVEKMLYFVAPEWWKPRERKRQNLGVYKTDASVSSGGTTSSRSAMSPVGASWSVTSGFASSSTRPMSRLPDDSLTNWADGDHRLDNYFITEESELARMGSSLGWLLQLDGDNLRNAFLNSPWVKAVIPIRPGKEQVAINWLQQVNVEGIDGLDAAYNAPQEELEGIPHVGTNVTLRDAINHLCQEVSEKDKKSREVGRYPNDEINDDNKVLATPIDKVYEHGFYPLQGGFRVVTSEPFEICDQWIEVLPTDQVVPVEVNYNPKDGMQI